VVQAALNEAADDAFKMHRTGYALDLSADIDFAEGGMKNSISSHLLDMALGVISTPYALIP
jgi:hypothetical protein